MLTHLKKCALFSVALLATNAFADVSPSGWHDTSDQFKVRGWSCDADNFNASLSIAIYDGTTLLGTATAGDFRSDLYSVCGNNPNHSFTFYWTQSGVNVQDGQYHTIYVYAQDAETAQYYLLNNSPQTVLIPLPPQLQVTDSIDTTGFGSVEHTTPPAETQANIYYSGQDPSLSGLIESQTALYSTSMPIQFRVDNPSSPTSAIQLRAQDGAMGIYFQATGDGLHNMNPTDGFAPFWKPYPNGVGYLILSFYAKVQTLNGIAYGHPTIAFFDYVTGKNWYLTIGTFGYAATSAPGPLPTDPSTGNPIFTTHFGADSTYGTTTDGQASTCSGSDMQPVCTVTPMTHFEFKIDQTQFQAILNSMSSSLSTDVRNHEIRDFHFNNEVSGSGAIGMKIKNATLQSYY